MLRTARKPATRKKTFTVRSRPTTLRNVARRVIVFVATRKGAWLYHGDAARKTWRTDGPHFLGHIINHLVLNPCDGRTLLAAAKTGHLGPTIFRSTDFGRNWKEAMPPRLRQGTRWQEGSRGRLHLLADTSACQRAERLVRQHIAAGSVPFRRRRYYLGAVFHY